MRRGAALALCAAAAASASGCLPFATPPAELQVGGARRKFESHPADAAFQLRTTVRPLSFAKEHLDRRVDFGVGYLYDTGRHATLHGAYIEGLSSPYLSKSDGGTVARIDVRGQFRVLYDPATGLAGRGGAIQLDAMALRFLDGTFESSGGSSFLGGAGYGEGGIGVYLEGAYSRLGPYDVWTGGGGLIFRMPATFGVVCCWLP